MKEIFYKRYFVADLRRIMIDIIAIAIFLAFVREKKSEYYIVIFLLILEFYKNIIFNINKFHGSSANMKINKNKYKSYAIISVYSAAMATAAAMLFLIGYNIYLKLIYEIIVYSHFNPYTDPFHRVVGAGVGAILALCVTSFFRRAAT